MFLPHNRNKLNGCLLGILAVIVIVLAAVYLGGFSPVVTYNPSMGPIITVTP